MKEQFFPLTYRPGILRDGSPFQGDYCTDGQWVRFFRGQPQNIGGMKNFKMFKSGQSFILTPDHIPTACLVYYNNDKIHILLGLSSTTTNIVDMTFSADHGAIYTYLKGFTNPKNTLTQFVMVLSTINNISTRFVLCLGMKNYSDITSATPISEIFAKKEEDRDFFKIEFPDFVLKEATGGMIYVANRLFLYGNNGLVRWSSIAQEKSKQQTSEKTPFLFFEDKYSINISTDKVIYAAEWRGGTNTPTIIFWTLSAIVLISNNTNSSNNTSDIDDLSFSKKVLSRDSSILSSSCVVEYDGIFYWPGTQRFFVFNGVVLPLENNLNRQTFFDTIDMNKRQRVFGVKNVAKDEIWWFYPEKGKTDDVGCTRAVIYNVVDNTWYDTAIERGAGFFDNVSGNMYSVGKNLVPYDDDDNIYVWQHEIGTDQVNLYHEVPNKAIPSYFTTPIISYATYSKSQQSGGIDATMKIMQIAPNIVSTQAVNMSITINSYQYPASEKVKSRDFPITEEKNGIRIIKPIVNVEYQGGNINFTFKSEGIGSGYQMGTTFIVAKIGDGRI
jgi:hypothetical protein